MKSNRFTAHLREGKARGAEHLFKIVDPEENREKKKTKIEEKRRGYSTFEGILSATMGGEVEKRPIQSRVTPLWKLTRPAKSGPLKRVEKSKKSEKMRQSHVVRNYL